MNAGNTAEPSAPSEPKKKSNATKYGCLGCSGFVVVALVGVGIFGAFLGDKYADGALACEGKPVPNTEAIGADLTKAVFLGYEKSSQGWEFTFNNMLRKKVLTTTEIAEATAVVCFSPERRKVIQRCSYGTDAVVERGQMEMAFKVVEANSGKTLESGVVKGAEPQACPKTLDSGGGVTISFVGIDVANVGGSKKKIEQDGAGIERKDVAVALAKFRASTP